VKKPSKKEQAKIDAKYAAFDARAHLLDYTQLHDDDLETLSVHGVTPEVCAVAKRELDKRKKNGARK